MTELKEAKPGKPRRGKIKKTKEERAFDDRVASMIVANRELGRSMPASKEALDIMEWAFDSQFAEEVAPQDTKNYRGFFSRPWTDEAYWRTAFDLALEIWQQAHDEHLKRQAAF